MKTDLNLLRDKIDNFANFISVNHLLANELNSEPYEVLSRYQIYDPSDSIEQLGTPVFSVAFCSGEAGTTDTCPNNTFCIQPCSNTCLSTCRNRRNNQKEDIEEIDPDRPRPSF